MLTDIQLLQIKNSIERILHVPGNFSGGILEMAIVADYHMPAEELKEDCTRIAATLKRQSETFRNVRLNLIKWVSDDCIIKEVTSLPYLQMGRAFEDYGKVKELAGISAVQVPETNVKSLDELFRQLKLFYARSKVILVLSDGSYNIKDSQAVRGYLQPFLAHKLLVIQNGEQIPGVRLFLETAEQDSRAVMREKEETGNNETEGDRLDGK